MTHIQEHKTIVTTASGNHYTVLLSAAIVEVLEQSLFYLTTALHVSGVTITHIQEHKTIVTTASGNQYTVLLSAAIVEELELQLFHDSTICPRSVGLLWHVCPLKCSAVTCNCLLVGLSENRRN
jgi:fructoselysine-6-P-deglycase FrlB-like protein